MTEGGSRSELFAAIRSLSLTVPEMRAGQLMAALGNFATTCAGSGAPTTKISLKPHGNSAVILRRRR